MAWGRRGEGGVWGGYGVEGGGVYHGIRTVFGTCMVSGIRIGEKVRE